MVKPLNRMQVANLHKPLKLRHLYPIYLIGKGADIPSARDSLGQKKMYRKSALAEYSNIDVETKTESQSPAQLITMLFDKACVLLRQANENLSAQRNRSLRQSHHSRAANRHCTARRARYGKRRRSRAEPLRYVHLYCRQLVQGQRRQGRGKYRKALPHYQSYAKHGKPLVKHR